MPVKKKQPGVSYDELALLKKQGADSVILDCRMDFTKAAQLTNHYLKPALVCDFCQDPPETHDIQKCHVKNCDCPGFVEVDRLHPRMLPTQASGRWSTTSPPEANRPAELQDCLTPDDGWVWLKYDFSAIEARMEACYSGDRKALQAYRNGEDIHTLTACWVYGWDEPPIKTKALHKAPECASWREAHAWTGGDDKRRHLMKTLRYGLTYGPNKHAARHAKGVSELDLTLDELVEYAGMYLDSRPDLRAMKLKYWGQCLQTRESRTFLGRRRKLFPTFQELQTWAASKEPGDAAKEGLNHMYQGGVADVNNLSIINVKRRWPELVFALNTHDAAMWAVPENMYHLVWPDIRGVVEKEWVINDTPILLETEWVAKFSDGRKEYLA